MKNQRAIYLLFAANSVSGFAQGITMIAIPWHFSNVLNLPSAFGNVNIIVTMISLFWGLYAGTLIDRHNRKHVFMLTSACAGLVLLSVALSGYFTEQLSALPVSIIFGATFFVYNIHYPNLFAFAQEITEPKDYGKIISWIEIQGQMTTAISMAVGAILYKGSVGGVISLFGFPVNVGFDLRPWELHEIFMLNAVTYFLALLLTWRIRYTPIEERAGESGTIFQRFKAGYDYLLQHPLMFLFGTASFFVFVTILVIGFYLAPIYINNHLGKGADVYASYEMYFALGSMMAGLAVRQVFRNINTVLAIIIMSLSVMVIYFICMLNISLAVFYLIGLIQGFCNAGTRVMRMTYLFHHIPNSIIGRTGGVFMTISVTLRLILLFTLSRTFFVTDDNVIYSFGILALFALSGAVLMMIYYKKLLAMPSRA